MCKTHVMSVSTSGYDQQSGCIFVTMDKKMWFSVKRLWTAGLSDWVINMWVNVSVNWWIWNSEKKNVKNALGACCSWYIEHEQNWPVLTENKRVCSSVNSMVFILCLCVVLHMCMCCVTYYAEQPVWALSCYSRRDVNKFDVNLR
jgi:hypothetical protein